MSLIITSNTSAKDLPSQSQIFKPYSYQNNLTNTLRIPPYSEIALQSTKIQKSGEFILSRENGIFFHYFGVPLGGEDSAKARKNATYATSIPMKGICGNPDDFELGNRQEVSINGFVPLLQYGMDHSAWHPNLVEGYFGDSTGVDSSWAVTVKRDAGVDFLGWNWVATQLVGKTTEDATYNWVDLTTQQTAPFTAVGNQVSTTTSNGYIVQDRRRPVALNNSTTKFDISGADSSWGVGLSRINPETSPDGDVRFHPETYNSDYGTPAVFNKAAGRIYADIMVMRVGDNIRVYQSSITSNTPATQNGARLDSDLLMKEITYFGAFNPDPNGFPVIYDIAANAQGYTEVRFKIENEEMKIYLYDPMADREDLLCDYTTIQAAGGGKRNVTYPIHQLKWNLYPTMYCRGAGNHLELVEYEYQTNYPVYDADNFHKWDFQENLRKRGLYQMYYPEASFWNDTSNVTGGYVSDGLLKPAIIDGGGKFEGFENVLITEPTRLYGTGQADVVGVGEWAHNIGLPITQSANAALLFGFRGRGIARPNTVAAGVCTLFSDHVPSQVSNVSLFVRLNNFTQSSVNARQGTTSKIVGHLPRFDNSGNDTGGLYFEPHEKTYLSLNNPDELVINSFDVDIVYDDERLCKALTGKTIVCFHIRQSKNLRF